MKGEHGLREVREEFPFLRAVDDGRESVVEVEPFVGCGGFAEESVILERLLRIRGEAV